MSTTDDKLLTEKGRNTKGKNYITRRGISLISQISRSSIEDIDDDQRSLKNYRVLLTLDFSHDSDPDQGDSPEEESI